MDNFEIIRTWEYYERIVFLTKLSGKYQIFYRSSGLAGFGTKGEVFPILLLKDDYATSPDGFGKWNPIGWLPKLYFFEGMFQEYRYKKREEFPSNMHKYLDFLEGIKTYPKSTNDPKIINEYCKKFIKSKEDYVDWKYLQN
jgi:hypothetical protein